MVVTVSADVVVNTTADAVASSRAINPAGNCNKESSVTEYTAVKTTAKTAATRTIAAIATPVT